MRSAATVYVGELDRMRRFYQECFGLAPVDSAADEYCVLESDAWMLSLVAAPDLGAQRTQTGHPPTRRSQTPIKLAFDVASIDDVRTIMPALGGSVDGIDREWDFRGFRHCDSIDPEGNVVQLRMALRSQDDASG